MGRRAIGAAMVGALVACACGSSPRAGGGSGGKAGSGGGGGGGDGGGGTGPGPQTERLRINSGCAQPMWVFYLVGAGGGELSAAHKTLLQAKGDSVQYDIPDKGLAAFRAWPGLGCDAKGNDCVIGQSGGPAGDGFTCPSIGCAPGIDSKFEGTFGCLSSVAVSSCQLNPVGGLPLPRADGWDTSAVDGYTVPFKVVVDGSCSAGPTGNVIDCSELALSDCPTTEDLNGTSTDLVIRQPGSGVEAGCMSPCSQLTVSQWNPSGTLSPSSAEAAPYCCPTPPLSVSECRGGPASSTEYVQAIHTHCGNTYAYAYDDLIGNFSCDAGTKYDVTFYCPE